ncbi:DoxX family protein [Microvirga sp. STS02]|uniref:DoxX family protein n=1 Tax=Hymenobacter negativus TaxID=2795026 RepID=UPI0018DC8C7A|nr:MULTISPECIES: DoxX family protein [Bacteria]MBH8568010.1 DoxX family protein [Hymenobacter negativus]MBR7207746.1 DoxX family protein [Microvirga sp. STS02]
MTLRTTARFYWTLTILFCLMMLADGVAGLLHEQNGVAAMRQLGYPVFIMDITGAAKILGALALLQNKYRTLKEWAFAGFVFDFAGAAASVLFAGMGAAAAIPALVMLAVVLGLYFLWKRYLIGRTLAASTPEAEVALPEPVAAAL